MLKLASTPTHQTENELLRLCARSRPTAPQVARVRTLAAQDVDWGYLVEIAERHEITPLLYRAIQTICPELVPSAWLDRLRHNHQEITRHNLVLAGQLLSLMQLFAEHNIQAVPLKGPLLAHVAYGDITLRQFSDLDILIQHDSILQARDLLLARGYEEIETKAAGHFDDEQHDIGLIHATSGIHVELHRTLNQQYYAMSLDPNQLLQSAQSVTLLGKEVSGLSSGAWLLTVCAHGTKHAWEQLKFVCDVGELLQSCQEINWHAVAQLARQTNTERALWLGVYLAHQVLDVPLPQMVLRKIEQQPLVNRLAAHVNAGHFRAATGSFGTVQEKLAHLWFQLRVQKGLRNKLVYFRFYVVYWLLLPGPADRDLNLPDRLDSLYVALRPFRLVLRYGGGFLKQLWKRARHMEHSRDVFLSSVEPTCDHLKPGDKMIVGKEHTSERASS